MSLPAFATVGDLIERRPGGVSEGDRARAQAALDDASALIRAEVGADWLDPDDSLRLAVNVPGIFLSVACSAARRAFDNPDGLQSEQLASGYQAAYANSSSDVYLTAAERRVIRKAAGISTLWTQSTTRDPDGLGLETANVADGPTTLVPVDPPGQPVPWTTEV